MTSDLEAPYPTTEGFGGGCPLPQALDSLSISDTGSARDEDLSAKGPSDADEIRRQVAYYFSADNLLGDMYLLGKIKGRKNMPIPLGLICSFRKMRQFQPFSAIAEALETSDAVNVFTKEGKVYIQRKEPFVKDDYVAKALVGDVNIIRSVKAKPTGFEAGYADPPLQPQEFQEEEELYSLSRHISERIETALQRYKARRKFSPDSLNVFEKWMAYGGISAGPKQFTGGMDKAMLESHNAAEIGEINATNYIGADHFDSSIWAIDFENVAKGFLSSMVPYYFHYETPEQIKRCVGILRNFYNYILHHNVCPEKKEDVWAARILCDLAEQELCGVYKLIGLMPGNFNIACSTMFDGHFKSLYTGDQAWANNFDKMASDFGMSTKEATQTYCIGMAAYADEDQITSDKAFNRQKHLKQHVVSVDRDIGLEVVEIIPPNDDTKQFYAGLQGSQKILGRLRCKSWCLPSFDTYDLPKDFEYEAKDRAYEFLIEQEILEHCFKGMKMLCTVKTLNGGRQFFDNIADVKCSFYTVLDNELLKKWREPRWITREEQIERDQRGLSDEGADVPGVKELD